MQCLNGEYAKVPPRDEIRDIIYHAWLKVKAAKEKGQWPKDKEGNDIPVTWSLDNCTVHKSAVEDWDVKGGWRLERGIEGKVHMPPDYSPDLHQIIEHAIGNMSRAFKKQLHLGCQGKLGWEEGQSECMGVDGYFKLMADCFRDSNGNDAIMHNCLRMQQVYNRVIELGGEYPERKWR